MHQANLNCLSLRLIRRFAGVFCGVVIGLVVGVGQVNAQAQAPAEVQAEKTQPTEAEQRWVDRFMKFIETGEHGKDLLNKDRLVRESIKTYRLKAEHEKYIVSLPLDERVMKGLWDSIPKDMWVTFLGMREREGERVALFRFFGDSGLNYIEWYLQARPDGEVWAWDIHNYVTGERTTETLQRMLLPAAAQLDETIRKHMGKRNRELLNSLSMINRMRVASNTGDHEQAIRIYEGLPESMQQERICFIFAMQSYFEVGKEDVYLKLLKDFLRLHGESSNRELMLMDVYLYQEKYDQSMQMINDLDERVGGDVYLESYRGAIAYQSGDYGKTKMYYDRGIKRDPTMLDFYWEAIDYALAEEDWPRISDMLDAAQGQGSELYRLSEVQGYEPYVKTQEYQRWLSRQTKTVQDVQNGVVDE